MKLGLLYSGNTPRSQRGITGSIPVSSTMYHSQKFSCENLLRYMAQPCSNFCERYMPRTQRGTGQNIYIPFKFVHRRKPTVFSYGVPSCDGTVTSFPYGKKYGIRFGLLVPYPVPSGTGRSLSDLSRTRARRVVREANGIGVTPFKKGLKNIMALIPFHGIRCTPFLKEGSSPLSKEGMAD